MIKSRLILASSPVLLIRFADFLKHSDRNVRNSGRLQQKQIPATSVSGRIRSVSTEFGESMGAALVVESLGSEGGDRFCGRCRIAVLVVPQRRL